jgi:hypothetical protein
VFCIFRLICQISEHEHIVPYPLCSVSVVLFQVSEQDDLPGSADELSIETFQSPNIQLFVLNNTTLLSLVEIPGLGEDQQHRSSDILDIHNNSSGSNNYNNSGLGNVTSEVRIILRDISGKFVWDTSSLITPPTALYDQMNCGDDRQGSVAGSYGRAPTPAAAWNAASAPPPNVPPPPFPCAGTGTTIAGNFFSPPRHTKRHRPPGELPTHEAAAADLDQLDDLLQYLGSVFRILDIFAFRIQIHQFFKGIAPCIRYGTYSFIISKHFHLCQFFLQLFLVHNRLSRQLYLVTSVVDPTFWWHGSGSADPYH